MVEELTELCGYLLVILLIVAKSCHDVHIILPTGRAVKRARRIRINAQISHNGITLDSAHGVVAALHIAVDTNPCDIITHACQDAEHGVTERAVGAISRSELLDEVHLAIKTILEEHEFFVGRCGVLNGLSKERVDPDCHRVSARSQTIGRNVAV